MFVLVLLEDIVRIPPQEFSSEGEAIHHQLNVKFANKVIEDVGLCIEVHDVLEISQGTVYAGDGGAFANVKFRMIVFKPFVGELLVGSVKSMDPNGIVVTLNFFDQVLVPPELMNSGCEWSGKHWYWRFGDHKLHISIQDHIRIRIQNVVFNPPESKRALAGDKQEIVASVEEKNTDDDDDVTELPKDAPKEKGTKLDTSIDDDIPAMKIRPVDPKILFKGRPMYLLASTNESGLGLTTWWQEQQTEPEGEYTEDAGEEAAEEAFGEDAGAEMEEDEGLVAEEAHNEENGEDDAPEAEE